MNVCSLVVKSIGCRGTGFLKLFQQNFAVACKTTEFLHISSFFMC